MIYAILLSVTLAHANYPINSNPKPIDDKLLVIIQGFKVFMHASGAISFKAKFHIDADGSPRAYGPNDTGLDATNNAKDKYGNWVGVMTDSLNNPIIQKEGDPYPNLYVSQTSLFDEKYPLSDTRRFVNSEKIPYIALPPDLLTLSGINLGDITYAYNPTTQKGCYAIFADIGREGQLGEGSIYLAKMLGITNLDPRVGGLDGEAIQYVIFPKTGLGNGKHRTIAEINQIGKAKMLSIGGTVSILKGL
jgi:Fungal chitosanase of glycosyl hydrolase group 75